MGYEPNVSEEFKKTAKAKEKKKWGKKETQAVAAITIYAIVNFLVYLGCCGMYGSDHPPFTLSPFRHPYLILVLFCLNVIIVAIGILNDDD